MQMNTIPPAKPYAPVDASRNAADGIREQLSRLDRNVAEVARGENASSFAVGGRDRALVEQTEIVRATRANARSLEVANQVLGTIIDIKV
ncbi:MAG: hypothetical protein OEO19_14370 [Gammaproteobacteria bacterium]|nr:hypothetical protein [Gammaproteobacteria bacterium]